MNDCSRTKELCILGKRIRNDMNDFKSLLKTMVDFVFDRHHYIMVSLFVLFLVFLLIVLGTNSNSTPYPM